jgi:hypothetical protein
MREDFTLSMNFYFWLMNSPAVVVVVLLMNLSEIEYTMIDVSCLNRHRCLSSEFTT